ncbi:ABC transporter ATP-binding protein [Jiella mangrovi]|uniref:ABC transporter ATP-binding protein n=1 Tax=Jiella mangrovi TaxID=2821407 RepID=A0ABS4BJR9_9HYPH|nr:ABC transporter ATP-binding protein [Jiella mangrovi]MBP0617012.1 ABC transporter ATP-binding protein [Jiella mangrovi]
MTAEDEPLLSVDKLQISHGGNIPIVEQLSFQVRRGETLGLVGESGCGKSLTALAIMGLLAPNLRVSGGRISLDGSRLDDMPQSALRKLRGNRMGMIFQEPLTALNPVMTIGSQIVEVLQTHEGLSGSAARERAVSLLKMVRMPDAESRLAEYPHQLSGGMRQRVVIAIAIACNPSLLIADEPTTALDVTVQAQILRLLKTLQREANLGLLLITHDLGVVRQVCDRVVVMYAGQVVEEGPVDAVLDQPRHPYSARLIAARPHGSFSVSGHRLADIAGQVPPPEDRPTGCVFRPRCPSAQEDCKGRRPGLESLSEARAVRCHHPVGMEA